MKIKIFFNILSLLLVGFLLLSIGRTHAQETPLLDWAKNIGGVLYNAGTGIATDASGNVYTTGNFFGTADFDPGTEVFNMTASNSDDGIFISKLNSNGDFVWAKSLTNIYNTADAIAVDGSGNVIIAGFFDKGDVMDFDPGPGTFNLTAVGYDMFVLKLNTNGEFIWAKHVKGGSTAAHVFPESITLDASGNIYTTGYFQNTIDFDPNAGTSNLTAGEFRDIFISKLDADGNFVWAKAMVGAGTCGACDDRGQGIALDASGNVYTAGFLRGTADFDPGPGIFNLSPTSSGGLFVSKLDNNGSFVWAKTMGGLGQVSDLSLDAAGNIYTTGNTYGTTDFDPGAGTFNLTSVGNYDIFISKLNNNGEFAWAKSFGSISGELGYSIDVDEAGNVYTVGRFNGIIDFDPGAGTFNLTGSSDYFLQKLDTDANFVWAYMMGIEGDNTSIKVQSPNVYVLGGKLTIASADFDPGPCFFNPLSVNAGPVFIKKLRLGTAIQGPAISSFTPVVGPIGTTVTITGTGFSPTATNNVVKFFNNKTATVTSSTSTSIIVTVPTGTITGKISVTTNCMTAVSTADYTVGAVVLPTITSFTPNSGAVGTTVTITGTNFSSTPANNTVKFNGTTAVVSASTATSITTTVPAGATTGTITVTVGGNTATSATSFTVTIAPTISFTTQPVDRALCAGASTTLSVVASGDTNLQYRWQIDNSGFVDLANSSVYSGVTTATLTITTPTTALNGKVYRCVVRGDNSVDTPSASADLTVNAIPNAPTIGENNLGCAPASATLMPTGAPGGHSYRYHDAPTGGNLLGSGVSFSTPALSVSTTYYISVFNTTTLCESTRTAALVTVESCNAPVVIATTTAAYLEGIVTVDLSSLISDPDNNLDVSSLKITSPPASGATATLNELILTVDYNSLPFPGTDEVTIEVCDLTEICTQQQLSIEVSGDVEVYNALSPNADGKNDTFILQYIDLFTDTQNNKVTIFNRWGDVVSEIKNYNNQDRAFKGLNKNGNEIPSGTYYYKIEFNSGRATRMGYLVLNR